MQYRDSRRRVSYAVRFGCGRNTVVGEIRNISRTRMLARIRPGLQRGQVVTFTLSRVARTAFVVRVERHGRAALRLDRPMTQQEFDDLLTLRAQRPRRPVPRIRSPHPAELARPTKNGALACNTARA
jgi:hypothetical protein